jgi:hypothetical protein
MAQFPCSHCGERYRGPQQTLYPAVVNGTTRWGSKQRLCPRCLAAVDCWVEDRLVPADSEDAVLLCCVCAVGDPESAVFITIYRRDEARDDWYGRVHTTCTGMVADALFPHVSGP